MVTTSKMMYALFYALFTKKARIFQSEPLVHDIIIVFYFFSVNAYL